MESIQDFILNCREHSVYRYVLSAPAKDTVYEKTVISRIDGKYQCEQYTVTQVFHRNLREEELAAICRNRSGRVLRRYMPGMKPGSMPCVFQKKESFYTIAPEHVKHPRCV